MSSLKTVRTQSQRTCLKAWRSWTLLDGSTHKILEITINFNGFNIGLFLKNITSLLKSSGKFYFSVPIGPQRIEFHAHRVFSLSFLMEMISPFYTIDMFSYVDDQNNFYPDVQLTNELINNNCNCRYGCGIFELIKKW